MIALFLSCILFESSKITLPDTEDPCLDNPDCEDSDGDGFRITDNDCDDSDPNIHPDAEEICDGVDNDCNDLIDDQEGIFLSGMILGYLDSDSDGFGGETEGYFCVLPESYAETSEDCDDENAAVYPEAPEICDGVDNNCDDLVDQDDPNVDLTSGNWFYPDSDGDGFGVESEGVQACSQPENHVNQFGDCEPDDPNIYPTAEEIPNDRVDQDCDGEDSLVCFFQSCDETLPLDSTNGVGIDLIEIPAGSDPLGNYDLLQGMMVMSTELTQDMMDIVEGMRGNTLSLQNTSNYNSPLRPVERIQWHEAAYAANLLTQYENSTYGTSFQECYSCSWNLQEDIICTLPLATSDIYSCDGYRLPTTAEWEYFTRAGATEDFSTQNSAQGEDMVIGTSCTNSLLSGTSDLQDYAWFCVNNDTVGTKNVAQKMSNPWGLYDVYGNVREWMHDDSSVLNPQGNNPTSLSTTNNSRLIRGGAYNSPMINMHNGFKTSASATMFDETTGFRLLRSLPVSK